MVSFSTSCIHGLQCRLLACAVQRRRFPVGASPTRQSLQPEAIGAVMEVTKWLKPSISMSRIGDSASVQAANTSEHRASSERTMCRPTRLPYRGWLKWLGELSEEYAAACTQGRVGDRVQPLHEHDTGNKYNAHFISTVGRFLDPFNVLESALGNRAPLEQE